MRGELCKEIAMMRLGLLKSNHHHESVFATSIVISVEILCVHGPVSVDRFGGTYSVNLRNVCLKMWLHIQSQQYQCLITDLVVHTLSAVLVCVYRCDDMYTLLTVLACVYRWDVNSLIVYMCSGTDIVNSINVCMCGGTDIVNSLNVYMCGGTYAVNSFLFLLISGVETTVLCMKAVEHCRSLRLLEGFLTKRVYQ